MKLLLAFVLMISLPAMSNEKEKECDPVTGIPIDDLQKVIKVLNKDCDKPACGMEGSVAARVKDCKKIDPDMKPGFELVTRTMKCREIYRDTESGVVWSDRIAGTNMPYKHAVNACKEISQEDVGGIGGKWRLPTKEEYGANILKKGKGPNEPTELIDRSEKRDYVARLPRMIDFYWTSTVDESNPGQGYYFDGEHQDKETKMSGKVKKANRTASSMRARCVLNVK